MQREVDNIVQRWNGKVLMVRKAIEDEAESNQGKVLAELTEKYMQ